MNYSTTLFKKNLHNSKTVHSNNISKLDLTICPVSRNQSYLKYTSIAEYVVNVP